MNDKSFAVYGLGIEDTKNISKTLIKLISNVYKDSRITAICPTAFLSSIAIEGLEFRKDLTRIERKLGSINSLI